VLVFYEGLAKSSVSQVLREATEKELVPKPVRANFDTGRAGCSEIMLDG
jgi:hypothetical protein